MVIHKNKKINFPRFLVVLLVIFNLLFYQFYPGMAVRAEYSGETQAETQKEEIQTDQPGHENDANGEDQSDAEDGNKNDNENKDNREEDTNNENSTTDPDDKDSNSNQKETDDKKTGPPKENADDENSIGKDNPEQIAKKSEKDLPPVKNTKGELENQATEQTSPADSGSSDKPASPAENSLTSVNSEESPLLDNAASDAAESSNGSLASNQCACENKNEAEESMPQPQEKTNPCPADCSAVKVENSNESIIVNDIQTTATAGNNTIGVNSDPPETLPPAEEDKKENTEPNINQSGDSASNATTTENNSGSEPQVEKQTEQTIQTGEAGTTVNVYNEINTNIVTENGEELVYNVFQNYSGNINLLEIFTALLEKAPTLAESQEIARFIEIKNKNEAVVLNNLELLADSGNNATGNGAENSEIKSEDAEAKTNIVNLINRNFVGNTWLWAIINIFGEWSGNLIVPGEGLLSVPNDSGPSSLEVSNKNEAEIRNTLSANADTGNNEITKDGNASFVDIETGNASSQTNVTNIVNTNVIKNNWFFLAINNMGSWVGKILNWNKESNTYETAFSYDFGTLESSTYFSQNFVSIENQNTAYVENNVLVNATTGNNSASGDGSKIQSGNASAWINVLNFINANYIGNNWFFGTVNIMGKWKGDLVFAYPDLEISISADKNSVRSGENLTYFINYKNKGHAKSKDANILLSLPDYVSYGSDSAGSVNLEGKNCVWRLNGLSPGEERMFTVSVALDSQVPQNVEVFESVAGIKTETKETELDNNYASRKTTVNQPLILSQNFYDNPAAENPPPAIHPKLKIKRTTSASSSAKPGDIVKYSIYVKNSGDSPVVGVVVEDKIQIENGIAGKYIWPIGNIGEGKEFLVEYAVQIGSSGPWGVYTSEAVAYGNDIYGNKIKSKKIRSMLNVLGYTAQAAAFDVQPKLAEQGEDKNEKISWTMPPETSAPTRLPLWIWIASVIAYFLAINWSLFPKVSKKLI